MTDKTTDRKRRHGPEPRPEAELRSQRVGFYVTADEYDELIKRAGAIGKTGTALSRHLGRFVRDQTFNRLPPMIPELNRSAWFELSKAAANLNQIARTLNQGDSVEAGEIRAALDEFRCSLIGMELKK
jgi:hypothetical protein